MDSVERDPWLERWLPLLVARCAGGPVLELGCGAGRDSRVLAGAGLRVVGVDRSPSELATARDAVPQATFHLQDLRAAFPVASPLGVVVASLCLHYFEWAETTEVVGRIRSTLRDGGVLVCRVNSANDHEYGASGHPRIGDGYYLVEGEPKRFFDRPALDALFSGGWRALHVEERVIQRYARPKTVWEAIFERQSSSPGKRG